MLDILANICMESSLSILSYIDLLNSSTYFSTLYNEIMLLNVAYLAISLVYLSNRSTEASFMSIR